jgi:hypothetical protein
MCGVVCCSRNANPGDSSLDEMMRHMYQDPDILEEKCKDPYGGSSTKSRSLRYVVCSSLLRTPSLCRLSLPRSPSSV